MVSKTVNETECTMAYSSVYNLAMQAHRNEGNRMATRSGCELFHCFGNHPTYRCSRGSIHQMALAAHSEHLIG